jgi:membrane-associated phospholipid phosphatase
VIDLSKAWPFGLSRRNWPVFAASFVLALIVLGLFDHPLSALARAQSRETLAVFNEITRWGQADWILYPSAVLLAVSVLVAVIVRKRVAKLALIEMIELYGMIFVGVGLPSLISNLLKRLIGRSRPELYDNVGTLGFHPLFNGYVNQSFPSGHTTTAFAAAMVLGFIAPRWFGLGLIYAVAVAASRLVLGAHYPTDVLGGAVLGTLGAYSVRGYFATRGWGFRRLPDGRIVQRPVAATRRLVRGPQRKAAR